MSENAATEVATDAGDLNPGMTLSTLFAWMFGVLFFLAGGAFFYTRMEKTHLKEELATAERRVEQFETAERERYAQIFNDAIGVPPEVDERILPEYRDETQKKINHWFQMQKAKIIDAEQRSDSLADSANGRRPYADLRRLLNKEWKTVIDAVVYFRYTWR